MSYARSPYCDFSMTVGMRFMSLCDPNLRIHPNDPNYSGHSDEIRIFRIALAQLLRPVAEEFRLIVPGRQPAFDQKSAAHLPAGGGFLESAVEGHHFDGPGRKILHGGEHHRLAGLGPEFLDLG